MMDGEPLHADQGEDREDNNGDVEHKNVRPAGRMTPLSFLAGQFMQVTVPGIGESPFTPSSDPHVTENIEFTIMKDGKRDLEASSDEGRRELGLRGPFGKPYPIKSFHGKDVYIIGGGVGLAPLRALFLSLSHELDDLNKDSCEVRRPDPERHLISSADRGLEKMEEDEHRHNR